MFVLYSFVFENMFSLQSEAPRALGPEVRRGCVAALCGHRTGAWSVAGGSTPGPGKPRGCHRHLLVGGDWNMTFIFPILGIIIPID